MDAATTSVDPGRGGWRPRLPERLPNLKGRWLTLYTIVWAIMLPIALVSAVKSAHIVATLPPMWTPYGFATTDDERGIVVDTVASEAARTAGLQPGDYVIGIDGWKVPKIAARSAATSHVLKPYGATTDFTFARTEGGTYSARLIRSREVDEQIYRDAGMTRRIASGLTMGGISLIPALLIPAAAILFLRRRREGLPALLSLAFLMQAAIFGGSWELWGVPLYVRGAVGDLTWALLLTALLAFPSGRFEPRWTSAVAMVAFGIAVIGLFYVPPPPIGFGIVIALWLSTALALFTRYRRLGEGPEQLQLRWVFFGFGSGALLLVFGLAAKAFAASALGRDHRWIAWDYAVLGPIIALGLGVMAVGLIVSILRFRLYDADAVIGRSAAYGLLTVGFVALFAASQKIIELLGEEYLGQSMGAVAGGIGAALAAVAIAPMHNRAQRWAERRFQNALYRLRCGLPPLVGDLRETSGIREIAGATLDSLVDGVRASRAALIANDALVDAREIPADEVQAWRLGWEPPARDGIEWDATDPLFPVRAPLEAEGHGRVGWLLLGPRPDGSLYGKSERNAIEEVAEPVARAVQVALSRQEREAGWEQRLAAIEKQLTRLQGRAAPSAA